MLFTSQGRSVLGKNCARGLGYRKTEGTISLNTDRPWLVNNIFTFF